MTQILDWHPAELLALVEGLPSGSRFQASLHGREFLGYTATVSALRDLADVSIRIAAGKKYRKSMAMPRPKVAKVAGRSLAAAVPRPQGPGSRPARRVMVKGQPVDIYE